MPAVDREVLRYRQHQLLPVAQQALVFFRVKGAICDDQIQISVVQHHLGLHRGVLHDPQLYIGITQFEGGQFLRDHIRDAEIAAADGHKTALQGMELIDHILKVFLNGIDLFHPLNKGHPERSQGDGAGLALKDGGAGLFFDFFDGSAEGGLGDVQLLCCFTETSLFVDRINVFHVAKHDGSPLILWACRVDSYPLLIGTNIDNKL